MAPHDTDQTDERESRVTDQMAEFRRKNPEDSRPAKDDGVPRADDRRRKPGTSERRSHT